MKKIDNAEFRYAPAVMFTADETWLMAREPVLRRMPDGSLFSLIYTGGPSEPHPENLVAAIRSNDDGISWSKPEIIFKHPRRSTWGTELFTAAGTPFAVFHTYNCDTFYQELRAYLAHTSDSGKTWSDPVTFPGVPANFCVRQGRVLSDGSWVFPVYWQECRGDWQSEFGDERQQRWRFCSGIIRSVDKGASWSLHGNCTTGKENHAWEPEIIETVPGRLRMFIRCESPEHAIWECDSDDFGVSWSAPVPGKISNPGTKLTIYKVRDRWVMLNNLCPAGEVNRSVLSLLTSTDGKTWAKKFDLARITRRSPESPFEPLPQMAYPHGFADDEREMLYLALDSVKKFFLVKIPYADILS